MCVCVRERKRERERERERDERPGSKGNQPFSKILTCYGDFDKAWQPIKGNITVPVWTDTLSWDYSVSN